MFEAKNVDIMVSTRYLIKGLSFTLNKNDKLAVIGEEGNGKSTLLKSILGICEYSQVSGIIDFKGNRPGYLKQLLSAEDLNKMVFNYLFDGDNDYYDKINIFYKNLEKLMLDDSILKQKMSTLSGGEKVKVGILKLLINDFDMLFLDEPTNDLDIDTLNWLEKFINNTSKPIVYVSHDETLLSNTANKILHLEQIKKKTDCRYTLLKTDYDTYVKERILRLEKQSEISKYEQRKFNKEQEKLKRVMNKVEYKQNTISRKDPHGAKVLKKKMHQLKSQEKRLDNIVITESPDVEESINFNFENVFIPKNKVIIKLDIPKLIVDGKILSKNIKLDVIGNIHLCIIGKNGVGKTTLIKKIYDELRNRKDIKVGYMPQVYEDILSDYNNVLDFLVDKSKNNITKVRMYLGNLNFTKDEMLSNPNDLSNGTKAKLILIKLVLDKCDCLILDEPTRNVSPLSNPVIRNVLKNFKGVIISVSHDRKYISEVIDCLYILRKDGLIKKDI